MGCGQRYSCRKVIKNGNFSHFVCSRTDSSGWGGGIMHSEIHKLIMLIWNKEELPHQWKESIVVPIHKKGDKNDCSNY
jgi:hypothetical protein